MHETAREVIAFFHVQLLSGAVAERGRPRPRISFRELLGHGEQAEERTEGTCVNSTLKFERIPLLLPPKKEGASLAAQVTELPKYPARCHIRSIPGWC